MENLVSLAITVMVAVILAWAVAFPIFNSTATLNTQNASGGSAALAGTANLTTTNAVIGTAIPLLTIIVIVVFVARHMMG